jgi:RNA polymerase sigma-70 factor (family 1)
MAADGKDERELLGRVAAGDQAAFAELFDSWHNILGTYIFGITKSKEVAEEIVLDIFFKIWMTREVLNEIKNFKSYLYTVSRNAAISELRKIIRQRSQHESWQKDQKLLTPAEDVLIKEGYLSLIEEAINQLPPQRKKIYLLSRKDGLKYEEIASSLGISRFTVRAHIQQAVDSILNYVKPRIGNQLLLIAIILRFF